jgi:hypothetical protein
MTAAFDPDEIDHAAPTSKARLKWIVAVRDDISPGAAANAIACVSAGIAVRVPGLIAPGPTDAEGREQYALPWAGCTIVSATPEQLIRVRDRATRDDTEVAGSDLAGRE